MDPRDKHVLITGSARGIGFETAKRFIKEGSKIILTDIDDQALMEAEKELSSYGTVLDTYVVDVADREGVEEMAESVLEKHGRLDVLINNAGIPFHENIEDTSLDDWKKVFDINVFGVLNHIYAFLPHMIDRQEGSIVNISSGQAFFHVPTWGAYAVSKLTVGALSSVFYYELSKHNINVTVVYPYVVNTDFYEDVGLGSLGSKLSMKFLPYYSHSPESIGELVFEATRKEKKVEMVSILNWLGYLSNQIPGINRLVNHTMTRFMSE